VFEMKGKVLYWILHKVVSLALYAFFQRIVVVGRSQIPLKGPLIFAANHPNMILDPLLVAATCKRMDTYFWAKSTLFKGVLGWLLRHLGAVPVYRRQDLKENFTEHSNDATFEASYEVLKEGAVIFIFPEGVSYTAPHIQPLRTGIARLALGFFKRTGIMPLIQPVGLNYVHKDKFRSSVLIHYGTPLQWSAAEAEQPNAVDILTKEVEARLSSLTINAPTFESLILIGLGRAFCSLYFKILNYRQSANSFVCSFVFV
jgi:glycerol-3-phosphate O-acyltransferase/dihydroxyacetone phosphate acyltransferase